MVIKRLSIIRQVNEAIERVCMSQNDMERLSEEYDETISLKKLVKIMNICHVYVPLVQVRPNNSSHMSLEVLDLIELCRSKEKYRAFVNLQTESLEAILAAFKE